MLFKEVMGHCNEMVDDAKQFTPVGSARTETLEAARSAAYAPWYARGKQNRRLKKAVQHLDNTEMARNIISLTIIGGGVLFVIGKSAFDLGKRATASAMRRWNERMAANESAGEEQEPVETEQQSA
jgi:hypothetical protein